MPLNVADRVRDTTTTTGTGTITLSGTSPTGYQTFSAVGNGNTTYYTINAGAQWEVGIGTYSGAGPTLSRDTVLSSSNSGSLVNFAAGTKDVFCDYPASKSISNGFGLLPVTNGGTGATSLTSGYLVKGNGTSAASASVVYDDGTNVGIGTSSPNDKLEVYGGNVRSALAGASATTFRGFAMASDTTEFASLKAEASLGETRLTSGFSGFGGFTTFYTNGSERMRIDSSGNVTLGIGGGAKTVLYNDQSIASVNTAGSAYTDFKFDGLNLLFRTGSGSTSERMRIDSSGNVGIGTSLPSSFSGYTSLTVNNASNGGLIEATNGTRTIRMQSQSSGSALIGTPTSHNLGLITASVERITIDTSGNVGIGTTAATVKLQVISDGAPAASGNMTTGMMVASGIGSFALNMGANSTGSYTWINSAYTNNSGIAAPMAFMTGATEQFRILTTGGITSANLADAVGYKGLPQNSQTSSYTLALSDMGKHISITTGGVVIPANASVAFPIGATVVVFNNSGSSQTISITTDTLRLAGTATTGSRTLAQYGLATLVKVTSTVWVATGNVT